MKTVVIVRGLPGCGKSTFAKTLGGVCFEADQYFYMPDGTYNFDVKKLGLAHADCFKRFEDAVQADEPLVILSNTSTVKKEFAQYIDCAKENGYQVFSVIVENINDTKSTHGVPEETLEKMKNRFQISL